MPCYSSPRRPSWRGVLIRATPGAPGGGGSSARLPPSLHSSLGWRSVIFPVALRDSGRKDQAWLIEVCLLNQAGKHQGSLNISNGGQARLGVRSRKATGLVCSGVQPSFASGLLLRGAGWQPPGIRPNLLFEEGCLQCLLHCLKNEVAVKSAMPHYCFRIAWAGLPSCDQRPQSSSSLPGKRLQTRVSCTAGVESISSQLFEGTLRDKYGKTPECKRCGQTLGTAPALPLASSPGTRASDTGGIPPTHRAFLSGWPAELLD